jgi:16S rRNA (cytosine1402-N4)-methyltransferase
VGIDRDEEAITRAAARLAQWRGQCRFIHGNFAEMRDLLQREGIGEVDGVLLDLGMSSDQVDTPERGFSFQQDGPLDMRMDRRQALTAEEVVNTWDEEQLAQLIWKLGEESAARRIARLILREREQRALRSTRNFAALVERAKGGRRGRIHPATKTFQALRMAVNDELGCLDRGLKAAFDVVRPGGRIAVIAFHSTEDRVVKRTMATHVGRVESLQEGGSRWVGEHPSLRWITKKPVVASAEETVRNPRARSARLRVVERIER